MHTHILLSAIFQSADSILFSFSFYTDMHFLSGQTETFHMVLNSILPVPSD